MCSSVGAGSGGRDPEFGRWLQARPGYRSLQHLFVDQPGDLQGDVRREGFSLSTLLRRSGHRNCACQHMWAPTLGRATRRSSFRTRSRGPRNKQVAHCIIQQHSTAINQTRQCLLSCGAALEGEGILLTKPNRTSAAFMQTAYAILARSQLAVDCRHYIVTVETLPVVRNACLCVRSVLQSILWRHVWARVEAPSLARKPPSWPP
jgi:hypothetical protein